MASGGRHGLAQSLFQVGGNTGSALGPLLAAAVIVPHGQRSVAWFALAALLAHRAAAAGRPLVRAHRAAPRRSGAPRGAAAPLSRGTVRRRDRACCCC